MTSNADRSGSFLRKIGAVPTKAKPTPSASLSRAKTTSKTPAAPALQFVPLDKIRALDQVRTEFDDQALQELAASIKEQGMLQPVLLRPDPDAIDHFIIIAGERRVRAAHIAGLAAVPALVGQTDEAKAAEMQLVENIQREELSLVETAAAVAKLYEKHQALKPIAQLTGKSLPWVSKHLAVNNRLGWRARMLLDSGKTEDLELVLVVSQIEALAWGRPQEELVDAIKEGRAGRTEARALLAEIKEKVAAENKATKAKMAAKKKAAANKSKTPEWTPGAGMNDLIDRIDMSGDVDIDSVVTSYTPEQTTALCDYVRRAWDEGHELAKASKLDAMRRLFTWANDYPSSEAVAAYILGANDIELSLKDLAIELRAIVTS